MTRQVIFFLSLLACNLSGQSLPPSGNSPLTVAISLNRPQLIYQDGDTLRVSVTANKDCYIRLIYGDANGKNVIIFPNYQDRNDKIIGGKEYLVPTYFGIHPPFGKETLRAYVSTEKFPDFKVKDRGDGLLMIDEPMKNIAEKLRSIGIFGEYAEQSVEVVTRPSMETASKDSHKETIPPRIEFTAPGSTEFSVETKDSILIAGRVIGEQLIDSVSLNGKPIKSSRTDSGCSFQAMVELHEGENTLELTATGPGNWHLKKQLTIKKSLRKFDGQRWAVVIGISDYQHPEIPDLHYAHRDAEAFYDFLKGANGGAFADDHIRLLTNGKATKEEVSKSLTEFLAQTQKNDLVMIYFAGHGFSMGQGYSYFLTYDSNPYNIEETALNMEEIGGALKKSIKAERVLIFSDACYSGNLNNYVKGRRFTATEQNRINRYLIEMAKTKPGILSFTSSGDDEVSSEAWLFWEHGIFTFVLISGLGGTITDTEGKVKSFESADANGDGIVTAGELMQYVTKYVVGYTKDQQHPQVSKTDFDWDMPLSVVR